MKFSVAATIVILALAAWLGWRDEKRIAGASERNGRLIVDAGHAGIWLDPAHPTRFTKRHRENRSVDVPALADGLLALFAKEETSRSQEEMGKLGDMVGSLDPAGFRELFVKLRESFSANLTARDNSLGMAIQRFSDLFPQASLEFLAEQQNIFETGNPMKVNAIHMAIDGWAIEMPDAALAWYRGNKNKSPDFSGEEMAGFLLGGIASKDPKLAFRIMDEFGVTDVGLIVRSAWPDRWQAALDGLREYAAGLGDSVVRDHALEQGLKSLSAAIFRQDFATSEKWLENAKLSPSERTILADNIPGYPFRSDDSGKWIEWIDESLPTEKAGPKIAGFVRTWAQNDYRATADWLATTPDGPAKSTSIRTYAEVVAEYQPETARQWAEGLPPGNDREAALKVIAEKESR